MARAAFLLPGLINGYGKIERRLGSIEGRLTLIERTLSIGSGGVERVLDVVATGSHS